MIIKSMSRKVPSFGQLLNYIDREEGNEGYRLRHNLMGRGGDAIRSEFERNAALLMKRKNGVYLYHEIISLSRAKGLSPEDQKKRLYEIAQQYIGARSPENLVYGGLHEDKEHSYHMHLMISSNRLNDPKRVRLTKAQFRSIQIDTERHVLTQYPELEQVIAIEKQSERRLNRSEQELQRRTGRRPKREEVLERLQAAYALSDDKQSFLDALGREDLELYIRGKNLGVVDLSSGKKHRLKTLDGYIAERIETRMAEIERTAKRTDEKEKQTEPSIERDQDMAKDLREKVEELPREAARHVAHEIEEVGKVLRYGLTGDENLGQTKEEKDREDLEAHMEDLRVEQQEKIRDRHAKGQEIEGNIPRQAKVQEQKQERTRAEEIKQQRREELKAKREQSRGPRDRGRGR